MQVDSVLEGLTDRLGWQDALHCQQVGYHAALVLFNGGTRAQAEAYVRRWRDDRMGAGAYYAGVLTAQQAMTARLRRHRGKGMLAALTWEDELTFVRAERLHCVRAAHFGWVRELRADLAEAEREPAGV